MTKKKQTGEQEKDHNLKNKGTGSKGNEAVENISDNEAVASETEVQEKKDAEIPKKSEPTAEEKLAEMTDKYLRLSAEFDNYRKRTLREKIDLTKTAGEEILKNIIPVMDDFERALKLMDTSAESSAMKSGIELIYNKFNAFLKQQGVKEIEAMNLDFNVDLHEAITKIPAPDDSLKGKVVDVVLKGYWLNDKIIRFSKVVVGE